ncbi:anti-sigma factor [Aurantiacibacter xanthus]|uniref:Anti-sigma factor n=1 Tax=Aurantiacibacter xanthus TaxID=1784712 RepID=A0A3A1PA85_9SPHN|nr:anti-sigma factor [Aurantiacibacter xanthus]RIV90667.1 anti-sigma factor [Aurantiacibacter xanthus]
MTISDEQLAAFADGELTGDEQAAVAAAVAADPALAQAVARHRALREKLAARFAPVLDEPLPARLTASLAPLQAPSQTAPSADNVVPFPARARRRWGWAVAPALAASLALAIFLPRTGDGPAGAVDGVLAQTLDRQLVADQSGDADPRILLSFRRSGGDYCRAFAGSAQSGIACREDGGWHMVETAAGGAGQGTAYRQAGSSELMALAQEMAVGGALDAEAEQRAQAAGWQAQ